MGESKADQAVQVPQQVAQQAVQFPQLPPFRLYGLLGCPHCVQAESFLRSRLLPTITVIANGDPIAAAGVKALTGTDEYPVLCCSLDNSIVKGFNEGEYERLNRLFHELAGSGKLAGADGLQQSQQAPTT